MNNLDRLTKEELAHLSRTRLGERAVAEIHLLREGPTDARLLILGLIVAVILGVVALAVGAVYTPRACPPTATAP